MSVTKLKGAVVGLGNIGAKFYSPQQLCANSHAEALVKNPNTQLVAGVDISVENRKIFEMRYQVPAYAKIEHLLESHEVELVGVASPTESRLDIVQLLVEQDQIKYLWLEKPLANDFMIAKELSRLIHNSKKRCVVNYPRRYVKAYSDLRNKIISKAVEIKELRLSYSRGLELNGSHLLNIAQYALGDTEGKWDVLAVTNKDASSPSAFLLNDANGIIVSLLGADLPYHHLGLEVLSNEGKFSLFNGGELSSMQKKIENNEYPGFYKLENPNFDICSNDLFSSGMYKALENLINDNEEVSSSVSHALKTSQIISEIRS